MILKILLWQSERIPEISAVHIEHLGISHCSSQLEVAIPSLLCVMNTLEENTVLQDVVHRQRFQQTGQNFQVILSITCNQRVICSRLIHKIYHKTESSSTYTVSHEPLPNNFSSPSVLKKLTSPSRPEYSCHLGKVLCSQDA
jgi:hypothetical protein